MFVTQDNLWALGTSVDLGSMSGPIASKAWSTRTLSDGIAHVANEAEIAKLHEEEMKLLLELQDPCKG